MGVPKPRLWAWFTRPLHSHISSAFLLVPRGGRLGESPMGGLGDPRGRPQKKNTFVIDMKYMITNKISLRAYILIIAHSEHKSIILLRGG